MSNDIKARIKPILRDCGGDANRAAEMLIGGFVIIPKSDLPAAKMQKRDGEYHVDCGSDWGTWNVKHLARIRETAMEYVAAWRAGEEWQAHMEPKLAKRREEICEDLGCPGLYPTLIESAPMKLAIDRIIALEQAA